MVILTIAALVAAKAVVAKMVATKVAVAKMAGVELTKVEVVCHQMHVIVNAASPVIVLASGTFLIGGKDTNEMPVRAFGVAAVETIITNGHMWSFNGMKMMLASMKDMLIWQFGDNLFNLLSSCWCEGIKRKSRIGLLLSCTIGLLCIGVAYGAAGLILKTNFLAGFLHGLRTGAVWWIGEKLGEYLDMYMKTLDEPDESLNPLCYFVSSFLLSSGVALMELVKCLLLGKIHVGNLVANTFWTMMQEMLGFYGTELFLWLQNFLEVPLQVAERDPEEELEPVMKL